MSLEKFKYNKEHKIVVDPSLTDDGGVITKVLDQHKQRLREKYRDELTVCNKKYNNNIIEFKQAGLTDEEIKGRIKVCKVDGFEIGGPIIYLVECRKLDGTIETWMHYEVR